MIEVYNYLNGHSPGITNDILKLEKMQSPKLSYLPDRKYVCSLKIAIVH